MGITHLSGLQVAGVPTMGTGLPFGKNSKSFFVDPVNGSDGNRGDTMDRPLQTLSKAHTLAVAGRNDVVYLIGNGQTSGTARESANLAWSKDQTHLIGLCAPTAIAARARIATTASVNFTPLITLSAAGCIWANIHAFHGYNTAETQICMNLTGLRNYFYNCHFAGMGHATAGDQAGSASLAMVAASENTFEKCTIGLDTIARSTTNAEIDLSSAATRNVFRDCLILSFADNAGHLFVKADSAADIDRFVMFDNCTFINATNSTATAMTAAINAHASAGGHVIIKDCGLIGATDWTAADSTVVRLLGAAPTDDGTGIAVDVDVTP